MPLPALLVLLHKQNRVEILTEPVEDHFQIIIVTGLDADVQADPGSIAVYPIHAVLSSPTDIFLATFSVRHTCPTSSRRALKYTTAMEAWNLKLEIRGLSCQPAALQLLSESCPPGLWLLTSATIACV